MTFVQWYLWLCCAVAVVTSLMLGLAVLLGGAGKKGGASNSPWPLVGAVTAVCLAVQVGYVAAPLAVKADGDCWRWALMGMAPLALISLCAVTTNIGLFVRQVVRNGWERAPRSGLLAALTLLGGVYVGAPLALWVVRG